MGKPSNYNPKRVMRYYLGQELCSCADPLCRGGADCSMQQFNMAFTFNFAKGRRLR
jgi:hypothetical protein